jgi:hypothetical protein
MNHPPCRTTNKKNPHSACASHQPDLSKGLAMSPHLRAAFFEILGFWSLWSIMSDLRTGIATNGRMTIALRENAGGFYLTIACKAGFVCFAIAVLLNALGLIDDPFAWLARTFPFMVLH